MEENKKAAEAANTTGNKYSDNSANSQHVGTPAQAIAANIESISNPTFKQGGHFRVQSMNDVIAEARLLPKLKTFYRDLWYEGSLGCLFGQSFLGKSILAMQIGEEIAEDNPSEQVVYIDCELNPRQILSRYDNGDNAHQFPGNFGFHSFDRTGLDYSGNYTQSVFENFKQLLAEHSQCRIFIIDNLTAFLPNAADGANAAGFMNQIKGIVTESKLSVLFVAHTPKIRYHREISPTDLAGGHQLFALFDDVFAIGKSTKGQDIRYVKQLKCRGPQGAIYQQEDQVLTYQVTRGDADNYLHFEDVGFSTEADHLPKMQDSETIIQDIKEMKESGMPLRRIGELVGFKKDKVARLLKKGEEDGTLL